MDYLLESRNLVKRFATLTAVNGISFGLRSGSCFGLLGPNGAGKTTTVEMLENMATPSSGEILYKGKPLDNDFRQQAGIMFQSTAIQDFITVREALHMFSCLYSHTLPESRLIEDCSLEEFLERDTRKLSGGQRQRLLLAMALVNDPDIVFLDEPTTGLDPQARQNFWALVRNIKARGKTILLTTHYMEEAYALCDEIAIMDHGKIIAQGSPRALLAEYFEDVVLQLPHADFPGDPTQLPFAIMVREDMVEILSRDVNETIQALQAHKVSLSGLQIRSRTLEDLFLAITGKELRQ